MNAVRTQHCEHSILPGRIEAPAITAMVAATVYLEDAPATDPRDAAASYTIGHGQHLVPEWIRGNADRIRQLLDQLVTQYPDETTPRDSPDTQERRAPAGRPGRGAAGRPPHRLRRSATPVARIAVTRCRPLQHARSRPPSGCRDALTALKEKQMTSLYPELPERALLVLIGPSGSGKSTLAGTWPPSQVVSRADHGRGRHLRLRQGPGCAG
ncbi:hypothetical protein [Streptomyces longwoodensis]|uniref:hypothetical protein n=1 Tax=Streptomyces longwoodensis TaxID=68231 RepID=UPI002F90E28B